MSIVSIVKNGDEEVEDSVRAAVELAGGFPPAVGPGSTVLIKPNVVSPSPSGAGNTTDARVTEAVTKMVLEMHPRRVVIGEGSSVGYDFRVRKDTMHCLEVSGTAHVARKLGVDLVDLNRDERVEVQIDDAFVMSAFSVARTAHDADAIIDVPVPKTHTRTGITCGLKNMKGTLPGDEKKRTHRLGLDRAIVDLNRVMKPDYVVVDGLVCMEGTHIYPDDCVPLGLILAGSDVVSVDSVCTAIIGLDVKQIFHVQLAAEAGLGVADLNRIEVRGERIAAVTRRFVPFREAAQDRFGAAMIVEKDACTGCMGEMISTFIYLKEAGCADRLGDLTLIMGTSEELPAIRGTPVVVGKCAHAYRHLGVFVPGCPPHGTAITDGACQALGIDQTVVHRAIVTLHDF